jgi:GGDEF domain-containing protein
VEVATEQGVARLSASAGVAALDPGTESAEELYARADRAMYASKAAGRDRVSTWAELEPEAAGTVLSGALP